MVTVLIADDTTLVRQLLAHQLAREEGLRVVGEAEDGRQAVELCLRHSPDIVLMDLKMPHMNGIEAMEKIRALRPDTRVILLSAYEELITLGHLSGASECLDKSCSTQDLIAAVRRVAASKFTAASPASTNIRGSMERLAVRAGLTDREKAVFHYLLSTDQTTGQIATTLSGSLGEPITESAVRHAIERIMSKLAIEPRTRASLVRVVLQQVQAEKDAGECDDRSIAW